MKSKTAVILTNYNMPEASDAMFEYFRCNVDSELYDFILVDNGSNIVPPSKYTTLRLTQNRQTTQGWLAGLKYADLLEEINERRYDYYLFTITSTSIPDQERSDILANMMDFMEWNLHAVGVHASLTHRSTTAWNHLINRGTNEVRRTWFIDNIFSLYRASWFNSVGRFDPKLIYAWGVDLETCYLARQQGKGLFIDDRVQVEKITDIGYKLDRMNMTAQDRARKARENMANILSRRYGKSWEKLMREEHVNEAWR